MTESAAIRRRLDRRARSTSRKLFESTAGHTVPASAGSWFYVFGSGTLLCFVIQVLTGICLALVYVPSASEAWTSLIYLNYDAVRSAGSCARCTTGARTSWSRS